MTPGPTAAERLMTMTPQTWARHANPWSGWTRATILPLLALAVWSRVWIGWWALVPLLALILWTWANPRLFPPPRSTDNWMSRGVLGEQVWLDRRRDPALAHHVAVIRTLTRASGAGAVVLAIGLWLLNLPLVVAGLSVAMLCKFWFLDRMVWVLADAGDRLADGNGN